VFPAVLSSSGAGAVHERAAIAVYAAGSLRAAFNEIAAAFEKSASTPVRLTLGASGLLRDRLARGEAGQVFASANMEHPQALAASSRAEEVRPFARNALCVLASPSFSLQGKSLARRLLDPDIRLGTSTPRADPSGDYAFEMFERIESSGAAGPGSAAEGAREAADWRADLSAAASWTQRLRHAGGGRPRRCLRHLLQPWQPGANSPSCRRWPCRPRSTSLRCTAWR
jgi:ABC-type molybdate transport system substrate-binding protein